MQSGLCIRPPAVLFLAALITATAPLSQANESDISDKQSELHKLQGEITELQRSLSDSSKKRQTLQSQLQQAEQQIGRTTRKLRVLDGRLERQEQLLQTLRQQQASQRLQLQDNQQALVEQIRSAYVMGRQERIKILLNQQDPATISRMMVYYDYFNRARSEQINRISSLLDQLAETEAQQHQEQEQLQYLRAAAREQYQKLQQEQAQRASVLALLEQDIEQQGEALQRYQRDEQQLRSLVKRLQEEFNALPLETEMHKPFKALRGGLEWPARGRLVSLFGTQRAGNLKWDGVVIAAKEGSEVKAIHHGRVAFSDWLRGFGLLMIIDHGDGYMSLYGHNQSLFKETGDWVEPGETIAVMGNSGGQRNAGVYFGIRYKGKAVNPKKWCKRVTGNRIGALAPGASDSLSSKLSSKQRSTV